MSASRTLAPASSSFAKARSEVAALKRQRDQIESSARTTMVMEEMPRPRDTFMLVRGQYDKKGEKVTARTSPASGWTACCWKRPPRVWKTTG